MGKHCTDTKIGIGYTLHGEYYLPNITAEPDNDNRPIGVYGDRHRRYLEKHRKIIFTNLLTSGKLHSYLVDIDEQAQDRFRQLVEQMAETEGVTEQLKTQNQMLWVGKMENICNRAMEIVNRELIYC